jgi:hypothetical protein
MAGCRPDSVRRLRSMVVINARRLGGTGNTLGGERAVRPWGGPSRQRALPAGRALHPLLEQFSHPAVVLRAKTPRHHPSMRAPRIFARPACARTSLIPSSHGATWRPRREVARGVVPQRPASRLASAPKRFRFTTKIVESSLQPRPQPLRSTCSPTASSGTHYVAPLRAS